MKYLTIGLMFAIIAIFLARAVAPTTDTYWHLAVGRLTWESKQILSDDPFVYGSKETHFVSTEWLAGLIYYGLVQNLGESSLVWLRVLMGLLTVYFFYLSLNLIIKNQLAKLNLCLIITYVIAYRFFDRPENFSFLFLSLINYLYLRFYIQGKVSKWVYCLPLIFLAWPNLHGFAFLGAAMVGFFCLLSYLKASFKISWGLRRLLIISGLSLFLSLIQYQSFFYFLDHIKSYPIAEYANLKDKIFVHLGQITLIQISGHVYIYLGVLLITPILLVALLRSFKKNLVDILLVSFCLGLLAVGIKLSRMIPQMLLLTIPILVLIGETIINFKKNSWMRWVNWILFMVLIAILLHSTLIKNIAGTKENYQVFTTNKTQETLNLFYYPQFPESAPRIINNYLNSKRLITNMFWSNYFLWFSPQVRVFSDAIWHYRTRQEIQDELTLRLGQAGWEKLLIQYDIDTVVNSPEYNFQPNHTPIYKLANWQLVYIDDQATIYARDDVIKSIPVDLSAINPAIPGDFKIRKLFEKRGVDQLNKLIEFDPKNGFAREQLIIYYTEHDLNKAKQLAEQSREILPQNPNFSAQLAILYSVMGDCVKAKQFAAEANQKSFNHPLIKAKLAKIRACN